jgi:hypothetical protein
MTPFHFTGTETLAPGHRLIEVPAHIASKSELLDFLAQAFPLPAYFGHNWDSLEECLLDLDWLTEPKVGLIHHDIPLGTSLSDQELYLRILAEAAQASQRLIITFPGDSRVIIEKLLAE